MGPVFTGIVEELGEIVGKDELGDSARFVIRGPVVTADARHGDSIAVNGVCLTVVEVLPDGRFSADVMAETLNRSSLAAVGVGVIVTVSCAAEPFTTNLSPAVGSPPLTLNAVTPARVVGKTLNVSSPLLPDSVRVG